VGGLKKQVVTNQLRPSLFNKMTELGEGRMGVAGSGSRHNPYRLLKGRKPGPDVSPGELHNSALPSTEFIANSESHH